MSKKLLYRREDRATVRHIFTWLEFMALLVGAMALVLTLFA